MQTAHIYSVLHLLSLRYDFFIVSQAVRFGCVAPTHYNVVFDNSGLKPDHMQRLTYKLCHMYYNWQVRTNEDHYISITLLLIVYNNVISHILCVSSFLPRVLSECQHHVSTPTNWPSWLVRAFTRNPTWTWMTSCTTCNLHCSDKLQGLEEW